MDVRWSKIDSKVAVLCEVSITMFEPKRVEECSATIDYGTKTVCLPSNGLNGNISIRLEVSMSATLHVEDQRVLTHFIDGGRCRYESLILALGENCRLPDSTCATHHYDTIQRSAYPPLSPLLPILDISGNHLRI